MTIYDWTDVPEDTKYIATDADGFAHGWEGEPAPYKKDLNWNSNKFGVTFFMLKPSSNPFNGDWKDSLEKRPEAKEPSHG